MKTSITNKIIVLFMIMVILLSLILIVVFQLNLSRYQNEDKKEKLNTSVEMTFDAINSDFQNESSKLGYFLDTGLANVNLGSQRSTSYFNEKMLSLFDWTITSAISITDGQHTFILDKHGTTSSMRLPTSEIPNKKGFYTVINHQITYTADNSNGQRATLYFKKDFLAHYMELGKSSRCNLVQDASNTKTHEKNINLDGNTASGSNYVGNILINYFIADIPTQQSDFSEIIYILIIVCLLVIITSFVLGRYLLERIGRPLDYLITQIGDINTIRIDKSKLRIRMDDEIGMLIDSFNNMKSELSDYMSQLERQNNRLETVFESISYSIVIIDSLGRIEMMNNRGGCFYHYKGREASSGDKCYALFAAREERCENCPVFENNNGSETEIIFKDKAFRISSSPIENIDENRSWLVISRHITDEIMEARKVMELDKLAQIGKVATAITHEIKNPIAVINSGIYYLENLRDEKISDYIFIKEFEETKELMKSAVSHAEHITQNLLNFSKSEIKPEAGRQINVDEILEQIMILYTPDMMRKRMRLVKNIADNPICITMEEEALKTLLFNLISNAIDEMDKEGTLQINIKHFDNDNYLLEVTDTGKGIQSEDLETIFNPFYTTKKHKKNIGLGLWIVKNEVVKAGGKIYAKNNEFGGATFAVILPKQKKGINSHETKAYLDN